MKLKMTFWNQIQALFDLILISCLYFGFWIFNIEILNLKFVIYIALPFIVIFVVPVLFIHLNYYLLSAHIVYEINQEDLMIIEKNKNIKYNIKDVIRVTIYMTPNKLKDSAVRSFPFESYYYVELQLINNKKLIITCLHSRKIDKIIENYFKKIEIVKIKSIFPLIKKDD
ncbi:hypothetical protein [Flavobacterium sp. SORGH_AS_0622]|uniref:hypothetical protein n=1 Tax=Flavobacterium sp. SORGH_AS_0622 TaxID=3041772 RepID=UPI0027851A5F|nr:hypothetical protein [Flavobacterium sp. SORGH_AS_0622]MDQ1165446.1 hypothetical protein [Flavobacterium sp. SORGH_AS_0622]